MLSHSCATFDGSSLLIFLCISLRAFWSFHFPASEDFSREQVMYFIIGSHTFSACSRFSMGVSGVTMTLSRFFCPQDTNNTATDTNQRERIFFIENL